MHRVNRCTLADTVWAPTSSNRAPAHCYPLPGRPPCRPPHPCLAPLPAPLGLRFRALLGLGFVPPPEPWPCAHCASIAYALLPAARVPLCRHRADPESSSRSLPSGSPVRIAPVAPTVRRHPRHPPHLSPRVAAAPGPWLARTAPYASLFAECAKKAPFLATSARNACFSRSRWQHPRPMHPFPGAIGRFRIHGARILPPRALFRVEESEITHGAKMLPAPPGLSAAAACGMAERALRHATAACDTQHGRTGFAPCGAGLACLPHAPPLSSRPRSSPPSYTRRASPPASRPRTPPSAAPPIAVGMSCRSGSSCRPRAAHADASCPSMRARRHRLGPDPRQPSPSPEPTGPQPRASRVPARPWSHLRPPAPRHPPRLALPRGFRCGSGNSCEMVR